MDKATTTDGGRFGGKPLVLRKGFAMDIFPALVGSQRGACPSEQSFFIHIPYFTYLESCFTVQFQIRILTSDQESIWSTALLLLSHSLQEP